MIVGIWWKFVLDFLNFGFRKFHWKFCEFRSLKFCETERFLNLGLLKSVEIDKLLNLKSLKLKEETFSYRYKKFRCTCIIDLHIRYNFYKILIFWFIRCSVNLYRLITQWYITKQFIAQFIKYRYYTPSPLNQVEKYTVICNSFYSIPIELAWIMTLYFILRRHRRCSKEKNTFQQILKQTDYHRFFCLVIFGIT